MCFHFQQQHFSVLHYGPNTALLSPTGSSYFLTWVLLLNNSTDSGRIIPHLDLCQRRAELDLWQDNMVCFVKHITRVFLLTTSQQTHTRMWAFLPHQKRMLQHRQCPGTGAKFCSEFYEMKHL